MATSDLDLRVEEKDMDFKGFATALQTSMQVVSNKTAIRMMTRYQKLLVANIWDQALPLEPLNPRYKLYKAMHGLDTRILISRATLVDSLQVIQRRGKGGKDVVLVGTKPGVMLRSGSRKVSLRNVARWLEYGTSKMPARPAWYLTLEQLLDESVTFETWYVTQLRKHLNKQRAVKPVKRMRVK